MDTYQNALVTRKHYSLELVTCILICVMALWLNSYTDFLAILIGTAQGGVQSLSRSLFGQLIPANRANEFWILIIFWYPHQF